MEGDEITYQDDRNATVLNNFFFNAITNLKLQEYGGTDLLADKISQPVLTAILTYRKHPNTDVLRKLHRVKVSIEDVMTEIRKLNST